MQDTPRYEAYEASPFFKDGLSSRSLVPGTIPRGYLKEDPAFYFGKLAGGAAPARVRTPILTASGTATTALPESDLITRIPLSVTRPLLDRGQDRFDIYCAPCHGRVGDGGGMIARRGFRPPPTFHSDRLRQAAAGHFFDVITSGFGAMPDYASQLSPQDRWGVIAYIRALQLSQWASVSDVPEEERRKLEIDRQGPKVAR
jgi:mono/diheme cytochrome c family protein